MNAKYLPVVLMYVIIFSIAAISQTKPAASDSTFSKVPQWAKDAIWYQMMVQRFRNGDKNNDPTIKDLDGTWPFEKQKEWHVTPWTDDPYKLEPWEIANGKGFYYNTESRRYGGDLQGVLDKLNYLKDLGINAIYFCPVFEAPAYHMYDTRMYHHIYKNFGPDPIGDEKLYAAENPADPSTWKWTAADQLFLKVVKEAHSRNIKVIVDGVFYWFGNLFWDARVKGKPPVSVPEFREYIHQVVKKWGDPNNDGDPSDGLDGWRLDMALQVYDVNHDFWPEFRRWVREINPNAILVGENWLMRDNGCFMINSAPWLQGDMFDSHMNYLFGDAMIRAFIDKDNQILPSELEILLGEVRKEYPQEPQFVLQNLVGTHDTQRFAGMVLNPDHDNYNHPYTINTNLPYSFAVASNHPYKSFDNRSGTKYIPTEYDRQIQKAIVTFQFTYLGAPYIYYGDEVGMWYGSRNPMIWDDLQYEPQHPFGKEIVIDAKVDKDMLNFYKSIIKVRRDNDCLRRGAYRTIFVNNDKRIFAFERSLGKERIRAVFNLSDQPQDVDAIWSYLHPMDPYKMPMGIKSMEWQLIFGDTGELNRLPAKAARVYKYVYKPGNENMMNL